MEMIASVLESMRKGDVMLLIDMEDAYFQIPICPDFRPYPLVYESAVQGIQCFTCRLGQGIDVALPHQWSLAS